jgi:hypothetical protein
MSVMAILLAASQASAMPYPLHSIGVVAGVASSDFGTQWHDWPIWQGAFDWQQLTALQAGVSADFLDGIANARLQYSRRGLYLMEDFVDERGDYLGKRPKQLSVDFLALTLVARPTLRLGRVSVFAEVGPEFQCFPHLTEPPTPFEWAWKPLQSLMGNGHFAAISFAGVAGLGARVTFGRVVVTPEVCYSMTLADLYQGSALVIKPRALQALVTLALR